jgi:hypothetical protein
MDHHTAETGRQAALKQSINLTKQSEVQLLPELLKQPGKAPHADRT